MSSSQPAGPTVPWRDVLLLGLLGAALFLPALGAHDLWNPDEARYAQVAREMWDGGHVFVPRLNGQVYSEKPPLLFWSIVAVSLPAGEVTETTARLPLALAAIAALLLVFRLGERFFGRRAGWIAAVAFATSAKVLWQGRFGQIDMLLTALVAAAVWFWARAYTEDRPRLYPLFFLFAGLATLAKGPVGLLPPLLSILAFLGITRDREGLRRLRVGRGLLIWLAVVLLWLGPAALEGGRAYFETMVFKQNVTRYADPWHHHQPWYYYLTVLPGDFFPWSFLLPAAVVAGWRSWLGRRREEPREAGAGERAVPADAAVSSDAPAPASPAAPRDRGAAARATAATGPDRGRRGFLFALCWVGVTLLFFSLSPAKRTVYVLTLYPALGLLVGAGLDRLAAGWEGLRRQNGNAGAASRGWLLWPLGLLTVLTAAVAVALPSVAADRPEAEVLGPAFLWILVGTVAALAVASLAAFVLALRREVVRTVASLAVGMGVLILVAAFALLPPFDAFKSGRPIASALLARAEPGAAYGIYPRLDNAVLFYVGRPATPLGSPEALAEFVARPERAWVLMERDDWRKLGEAGVPAQLPPLVEVARDQDLHDGYLLLTEAAATGR